MSNQKLVLGQRSTLRNHVTTMSSNMVTRYWSAIPLLTAITWASNVKEVRYRPRLSSYSLSWSMAANLRDSVVVVVRTRPQAIPLAMITMWDRRRGGLMISSLDTGESGPGSSPGRGHCVVFLGKTLYSHIAPLHPGV